MFGTLDLDIVTEDGAENVELGTAESLASRCGRADRAVIFDEKPPVGIALRLRHVAFACAEGR